jgi:tryptophan synthase alpha subunit
MASRIASAFKRRKPAFVAYITAGHPHPDITVPALLAMQESGEVDVIEVGRVDVY